MTTIISRADAEAAGLKHFFTGVPCKRGHVCERYVSGTAGCIECSRLLASMPEAKARIKARDRARSKVRRTTPEGKAWFNKYRRGVADHEIPAPPADGRCELCGEAAGSRRPWRLVWDHDHDLEALGYSKAECHRGWLCSKCNRAMGLLGDNVQGLLKAADYIRRALLRAK